MPTRNGGSSANQSLRSDVGGAKSDTSYYAENLKFFREYGNTGKDAVSAKAVSFADKADLSPDPLWYKNMNNSTTAVTLSQTVRGFIENPDVAYDTAKTFDAILGKVFENKEINDGARALAQKITEQAFETYGRSEGREKNAFSISEAKPNGIAVTPVQMRADIESLLMNYAGALAIGQGNRLTSGKAVVDSTLQRIERESRAYGQYGNGGIPSMLNKAFSAFNSYLNTKIWKAVEPTV
jgi:hypothetical protein